MELFTLNRKFLRQDVIDGFASAIWTERYYGNGDVELVVPPTTEMFKKLSEGTFLSLNGSDTVMIVETIVIEKSQMKVTGIALLPWLNNRFVRTSPVHADKVWVKTDSPPGKLLWDIVFSMCSADSAYLNGGVDTAVPTPLELAIPGLVLKDYDRSGSNITAEIPFGPVYDALYEIATTFEIGMSLTLESATDTAYTLGFRSYKGLDRTSRQTVNPIVRFSPQTDSLTDIKELRSIAALKTLVYTFAPALQDPVPTVPGAARLTGSQYTGFDLRALQVLDESITTDAQNVITTDNIKEVLNNLSVKSLAANPYLKAVDGEIVPENPFKYGRDYNLGDIVEVQGNSDVVQISRVTEYIRVHDEAGERAYPTVAVLD